MLPRASTDRKQRERAVPVRLASAADGGHSNAPASILRRISRRGGIDEERATALRRCWSWRWSERRTLGLL